MLVPIEIVILVAGIAASVFSAITINSLDKLKKSCTTYDKKQYDLAKNFQIAQLVIAIIVTILSGWVVIGSVTKKKGYNLPGAAALGRYARQFAA